MPEKTETLSVRVTKQRREELQDWAEEQGLSEADAVRRIIEQCIHDQQRLDEINRDEELREKLESIEANIKELHKPWWDRLF